MGVASKAFAARLVMAPFVVASTGFALSILWRWFVVPLGAPAIGMWHAAGLSAFVGFVTMKARDYDDVPTPNVREAVLGTVKRAVFAWLFVLLSWPVWGLMP